MITLFAGTGDEGITFLSNYNMWFPYFNLNIFNRQKNTYMDQGNHWNSPGEFI